MPNYLPDGDAIRAGVNAIRRPLGLPDSTYETEAEREQRRGIPAERGAAIPLADVLPEWIADVIEDATGAIYAGECFGWQRTVELLEELFPEKPRAIGKVLAVLARAKRESETC